MLIVLTSLKLDRNRLVGAFHQEPTMPVSQALCDRSLESGSFSIAPERLASVRAALPDELHVGGRASFCALSESQGRV